MRKAIYFCLTLVILSCNVAARNQTKYDIRADIRLGNRFYSIYLSENGYGYVSKGTGSFYTEPLEIDSSLNSSLFKIDSIKELVHILNSLSIDSTIKKSPMGTVPRVEIYYKGTKVYDAYRWNESVWNDLRPVIPQLPRGFNPFLIDDHPFE